METYFLCVHKPVFYPLELTHTKKRTARPSAHSPQLPPPSAVVAAVSAGGWQMGFQWVPSPLTAVPPLPRKPSPPVDGSNSVRPQLEQEARDL